MDPNANLKEQAETLIAIEDHPDNISDKRRLAELRRALLGWLTTGGFEPDWKAYPEATKSYRAWVRKMNKFGDLHR